MPTAKQATAWVFWYRFPIYFSGRQPQKPVLIFLLKETSVFSVISLMDLMFTAKDRIAVSSTTVESLFLVVVFYLIVLLPVSIIGSVVERRLRYASFGN